jgi:hypothetical protein
MVRNDEDSTLEGSNGGDERVDGVFVKEVRGFVQRDEMRPLPTRRR